MEELPRLYVEEIPEDQKRSKLAITIMVLVLLAMPLGVYLTLQTQNPFTKASTQPQPITTEQIQSLTLHPRLEKVTSQSVFPVDVRIVAETKNINLINAKIKYPKDVLEIIAIASKSADLTDTSREYVATEWLDAQINNREGELSLAAGIPNPGLKTMPNELTQKIMTTIYFKAKEEGEADITIEDGAMMLTQEGATNSLLKKGNAKITINSGGGDFVDRTFEQQARIIAEESTSSATLKILSPNGGEVFSYYKPVLINWFSTEIAPSPTPKPQKSPAPISSKYRVSIIMNGEFLGQLTEIPGNINTYTWDPSKTLTSSYIKPENKFQIEIIKEENGQQTERIISQGPFSLVLSESTTAINFTPQTLTIDRTDINGDRTLDLIDASIILRNYLAPVTEQNFKADINNDRVINAIDLYLLKQSMRK